MITCNEIDNLGFAKCLSSLPKPLEIGAIFRMTTSQREAYDDSNSKSAFQKRNQVNMSVVS